MVAAITRTSTLRAVERSDALHFLVLQNAQQLGLRGQRHIADLIQEQRAAVGVLEQPGLVVGGAGEGALDVAEQFAFKQRLHHGRAVQHHVAARRCRAQAVQRLRHQILAGPGLAGNQHGAIMRRHAADASKTSRTSAGCGRRSLEFGAGQQLVFQLQRMLLPAGLLHQLCRRAPRRAAIETGLFR